MKANKKTKNTLFIVWLIPLVAMIVAAWMVYEHYSNQGVDIVIEYDSGKGFEIGKTKLIYKGLELGKVKDIKIDKTNLKKALITVEVQQRAAEAVLREGNNFLKVEPKITLNGVKGLSTLISGAYIELYPFTYDVKKIKQGKYKDNFIGITEEPLSFYNKGVFAKLKSKDGELIVGSPVLYKNYQVGKILKKELIDENILYTIHVQEEYKHLLKEDSKFFKVDALDLKASLKGMKLKVPSIASMIAGGVTFSSPKDSAIAKTNTFYTILYSQNYLDLNDHIITLKAKDAYKLDKDFSKIYFKGMEAGNIVEIKYDLSSNTTFIRIRLKEQFYKIIDKDTYFWIVEPKVSFRGVKDLDALSGSYLTFQTTMNKSKPKDTYKLHKNSPKTKGKRIHLEASKIGSLKEGGLIFYKDVEVGHIESVKLNKRKNLIDINLVIYTKYSSLVNDTSAFYLQSAFEAEATLDKFSFELGSLETILYNSIALTTYNLKAKHKKNDFILYKSYKDYKKNRYFSSGGKMFTLVSDEKIDAKVGSSVYYKNFKAGEIYDIVYKKDKMVVKVFLKRSFASKVGEKTKFYLQSGIDIEASLSGVKIKTKTLDAILDGSIVFRDFEYYDKNRKYFKLYKDEKTALDNTFDIELTMSTQNGLKKGSKVLYKGFELGSLKDLELLNDGIKATLSIDKKYKKLFNQSTIIYLDRFKIGLDGIKNASSAVFGPSISIYSSKNSEFKDSFVLKEDEFKPSYHKEGLSVVLKASRKSSLKMGSPIYYRQLQIGWVDSFELSKDSRFVDITVFIEDKYKHLVRKNSIFYNATAFGMDISLFGVKVETETVETMLSGGIALITPEDYTDQAKDGDQFILELEPESDWLEYSPCIEANSSKVTN